MNSEYNFKLAAWMMHTWCMYGQFIPRFRWETMCSDIILYLLENTKVSSLKRDLFCYWKKNNNWEILKSSHDTSDIGMSSTGKSLRFDWILEPGTHEVYIIIFEYFESFKSGRSGREKGKRIGHFRIERHKQGRLLT